MADLRETIERLSEEQGWSEDSLVGLLVEAINNAHVQEPVIRYLEEIAKEENEYTSDLKNVEIPSDEDDVDDGPYPLPGQVYRLKRDITAEDLACYSDDGRGYKKSDVIGPKGSWVVAEGWEPHAGGIMLDVTGFQYNEGMSGFVDLEDVELIAESLSEAGLTR